ncbi:MFS transporter [Plantibacter sp. YIM 135347]|uniref:MFS transporter n=1 Tax=Plantibacter sp. YIM 135347 TaxID=3423919 RepID=UPI003D3492E7
MTTTVSQGITPRLRRARVGVFGIFFVVGFLMAIWLVNIPAIQEQTGVSHAVLGGLILLLGLGSFIAMQVTGVIIDKLGSRFATMSGVILMIVAVNLPGLATDAITLGIALFVFGLGNGAADVAMNHQAVVVEREYPRPIMSAFHAFFSFGGAAGALLGALAQSIGLDLHWSLLGAAVLGAVLAAFCAPMLLSTADERGFEAQKAAADATEATTDAAVHAAPAAGKGDESSAVPVSPKPPVNIKRRVFALATLAFLLMLSEGVANDWSALQAVEHLAQPEAAASLAYGAFAIMMTIGRLCADRVSHAFGAVNVVRYGSAAAALGMLLVVVSPVFPLTLVGWALFGVGMSGVVPQIFTAAGNLDAATSGVTLSRVVGAGYIGILAGPAVIGFLGGVIGLTLAFILPIVFCVLGVFLAPIVSSSKSKGRVSASV